jgi:hypothetical protein
MPSASDTAYPRLKINPRPKSSMSFIPRQYTSWLSPKNGPVLCIAAKRGTEVTLFSRREKVLNKRFPGVATALASFEGDFILDGELVALDSQGRPSFQLAILSPRISSHRTTAR